jgi:hypothetical protein
MTIRHGRKEGGGITKKATSKIGSSGISPASGTK